ncbi:MAG: preprotein translocase subunit SecG [Rickettsiales bacterium]|nr:preprotein translocase subunit SecG [Rickettsiales bacterium]
MYTILLVIHTIIVLFLIGIVLLQRTDSDGLSGLSGGGGNQFLTGRGSANLMTRTTAILAGAFMITSLVLVVMGGKLQSKSIVDDIPADATAATASTLEKTASEPKADKKAAKPAEKKETPAKAAPSVPKPE